MINVIKQAFLNDINNNILLSNRMIFFIFGIVFTACIKLLIDYIIPKYCDYKFEAKNIYNSTEKDIMSKWEYYKKNIKPEIEKAYLNSNSISQFESSIKIISIIDITSFKPKDIPFIYLGEKEQYIDEFNLYINTLFNYISNIKNIKLNYNDAEFFMFNISEKLKEEKYREFKNLILKIKETQDIIDNDIFPNFKKNKQKICLIYNLRNIIFKKM